MRTKKYRQASLHEYPVRHGQIKAHIRVLAEAIKILEHDQYAGLNAADDALHALREVAIELKSWLVLPDEG